MGISPIGDVVVRLCWWVCGVARGVSHSGCSVLFIIEQAAI